MRVLHVITGLRSGGAENQLLLLGRHSRHEQVVVALTNAEEIADALRGEGTDVLDLGMRSNRDVLAVLRLAFAIRHRRPDVVHVHLYRGTVYGRIAARLAGVPVVVTTEHSLLDGYVEGRRVTPAIRRLYMATEPLSDVTIAVSEETQALLRRWGVAAQKLRVIPNGVDADAIRLGAEDGPAARRELGIPPGVAVVGALGRLYPSKRLDVLLRGLAPHLGPELRLLFVGSGEHECRLREIADALGVADSVVFAGTRDDVPRMLGAMDVLASSSPQETFGLALVEAALAGVPVVFASAPALHVLGEVDGVRRVASTEAGLRDGVLAALAEPSKAPPRESLDRYDVATVARQVDALYAQCLESARRRRRR